MSATEPSKAGQANHPLAPAMAAIGFLHLNITLACIWGSFSVLLGAVEARLGVGRELSTAAVPLMNLSTAVLAAVVGALMARLNLKLVMSAGAAFSLAAFVLLALAPSYPMYLVAYGLLLGPGMAVAVVATPTLVTRWFTVHGGRALGLATTPALVAVMPLATNWMLHAHGLPAAYGMLAAIAAVNLAASLLVRDRPPGAETVAAAGGHGAHGAHGAGVGGFTMPQLVRKPGFWALTLAYMASAAGSVILGAHMVPMAHAWGYSATLAATLLSIQSFAGIAGTVVFGWIADRLGGARALALLASNSALLWALLLLHVPFPGTAALIALLGLNGAGAVPVMSTALSEVFGKESFSRAYGLANLVNLPVSVLCVPAAALVYSRTGSYAGAMVGQAAFLLLAGVLVFTAVRGRLQAPAAQAIPTADDEGVRRKASA